MWQLTNEIQELAGGVKRMQSQSCNGMATRRRTEEDRIESHLGGVELVVGVAVLRVGAVVAVGPEAVDAEVRRRLAGLGVTAALLGVAVGAGPLQDEEEEVVVLRRRLPGDDGQDDEQERQGQARRHGRSESSTCAN